MIDQRSSMVCNKDSAIGAVPDGTISVEKRSPHQNQVLHARESLFARLIPSNLLFTYILILSITLIIFFPRIPTMQPNSSRSHVLRIRRQGNCMVCHTYASEATGGVPRPCVIVSFLGPFPTLPSQSTRHFNSFRKTTYKPAAAAATPHADTCLSLSLSSASSLAVAGRFRIPIPPRRRVCFGATASEGRWAMPQLAAGMAGSATRRRWWARTARWTAPRWSGSPPPRGSRGRASPTPSSPSSGPRAAVRFASRRLGASPPSVDAA